MNLLFLYNKFLVLIFSTMFLSPGENLPFKNSSDIGDAKMKGSMVYDQSTNTYTLAGGGENMWANADEFFMTWREETGDFSFSSALAFETKDGNTHKKMGLMIRESLAADAKYVDVVIHNDGLVSLQYRAETGGITKEITTTTRFTDHVVLARSGKKIIIKTGIGGYPQQITGEIEIDFPGKFYVGMVVCAHEAGVTRKAIFSDVVYQKIEAAALPAQTAKVQEGSVIFASDGKTPAGIVYQFDASTGKGYMVSVVEAQLPWGCMGVDAAKIQNHINSKLAEQELSGAVNTSFIVEQLGSKADYAAGWCAELSAGGFTDWYLPSCGELNALLAKKNVVNTALQSVGAPRLTNNWHWSSSEGNPSLAWNINFSGGDIYPIDKSNKRQVRAIRAFSVK
ncbi:MAG: DUF1566 domain-containing protein [Tannerellaceae bacterium]|jgi:hypothetical protein|nr:DUF1566 domain-containing protein [Tannerellaceae bacterium]